MQMLNSDSLATGHLPRVTVIAEQAMTSSHPEPATDCIDCNRTTTMTAAPSLTPHASAKLPAASASLGLRIPAPPELTNTARNRRALLVVCLTVLAALLSASLWLDVPPATQGSVRLVDSR